MPDYKRIPYKLAACRGVSLRYPPDLLPEGFYPAINNMEAGPGQLSVRKGISELNANNYGNPVHSMRRLQDLTDASDAVIIGSDVNLYTDASAVAIDTGYSGNPLSFVPMRPLQSPRPWMYIADSARMRKVNTAGTNYNIGIAPPTTAPAFTRGGPNQLVIDDFEAGAPGWAVAGTSTGFADDPRFAEVISAIVYDVGSTGWACIAPAGGGTPNYQAGARCVLTSGGGNETVEMRQVYKAITPTTIASILYDIGTSGPCSITLDILASEFTGLVADSMVALGGTPEYARVLSVAIAVDGTVSFRCSTVNTHAVGDGVTGIMSFRAYAIATYAIADTITGVDQRVSTTVGAGWFYNDTSGAPLNLSNLNGRPIQTSDYIHISLKVDTPANLTTLRLYFNVATAFPAFPTVTSAYFYDVDVSLLNNSWQEVFFKVSELQTTGIGIAEVLNLSAVTGLIAAITASGNVDVSFDAWWIGGTFGPDSRGLTPYTIYQRFRSSITGAISNPSPPTPATLDLMREDGIINPVMSTDPQVDLIDFFAIGGNLTVPRKIGTAPITAVQFDYQSTDAANAVNEILSFTNFQPFPLSDLPRTGTVNVVGTAVEWVSGDVFNPSWQAGSQVIINSIAYTLYAPPTDTHHLILVENAGTFGSPSAIPAATFFIPEATLGGQPLSFIWGPDPLTSVMFGVGTGLAAGTLFWTNPGDPDSASDANVYEVCSPSEPLLGGFMYNGASYVWSNVKVYRAIAQTITDPITGTVSITYRTQEAPNFKGIFSGHSFAVNDLFWQVTADGIYQSAGGVPVSITDATLYPLFTHEGRPGVLTNGYYPVDWSQPTHIRLFATRGALYFTYMATNGATTCWKYDRTLPVPGWFHLNYTDVFPLVVYADELQGSTDVLMSGDVPKIYKLGQGTTDNGAAIAYDFNTPALDGGEPRAEKLCLDYMLDVDPANETISVQLYGDNLATLIHTKSITALTGRRQIPVNPIDAALTLYRNYGLYISSTTSSGLPTFYEFEPNLLLQPYLAINFSNQYQSHRFTNYGHIRDGWIMYISTSTLTYTITVDGGTPYTFSIPSSAGRTKKLYLMDASITPPAASAFTRKGKVFLYSVTSETPFLLFTDETVVNAKEWGSGGMYQPFKPFVGQTA